MDCRGGAGNGDVESAGNCDCCGGGGNGDDCCGAGGNGDCASAACDSVTPVAKAMHAHTMQFRDTVCAEGPKPKVPTLSDAIGTTPLDTSTNTKTGRGTLDTLTGNPLAK